MVLHSAEFRDGNAPAGWDIIRVLKEALASLPEGVEQVFMRQDTAAYTTDVLAFCEREKEHPEYGRIQVTISADVTVALQAEIAKVTDWTPEVTHGKQLPAKRGVGRGLCSFPTTRLC